MSKPYSDVNNPWDRVAGARESLSDTANQVREAASDLGDAAARRVDEGRYATANALEDAADAIDDNADSLPGGGRVANAARRAASKIGAASGYIRRNDFGDMMSDVEDVIKRNPLPSLLTAAAVGFFVGRAVMNRD